MYNTYVYMSFTAPYHLYISSPGQHELILHATNWRPRPIHGFPPHDLVGSLQDLLCALTPSPQVP